MARTLAEIEKEVSELDAKEKATLARNIIDDLDDATDEDVERLWLEEARRRHQAYLTGKACGVASKEVFSKARQRIHE